MPDNENATCDVLVIGGGGAGLAAAIEAQTSGATTILIEKNDTLGGTTAWSIGSGCWASMPHGSVSISVAACGHRAFCSTATG